MKVDTETIDDDKYQVDFSTHKSNTDIYPKERLPSSIRSKKRQGFIPRELLLFLDLDMEFINDFMKR